MPYAFLQTKTPSSRQSLMILPAGLPHAYTADGIRYATGIQELLLHQVAWHRLDGSAAQSISCQSRVNNVKYRVCPLDRQPSQAHLCPTMLSTGSNASHELHCRCDKRCQGLCSVETAGKAAQ